MEIRVICLRLKLNKKMKNTTLNMELLELSSTIRSRHGRRTAVGRISSLGSVIAHNSCIQEGSPLWQEVTNHKIVETLRYVLGYIAIYMCLGYILGYISIHTYVFTYVHTYIHTYS